jgi:SAM-dependent methyltransferase
MNNIDEQNQWWKSFYDETFVNLLLLWKDQEEIDLTTNFLIEKLELKENSRVFDQCCGVGSLSIPLAKKGMEIIGVDLGADLIKQAQKEAKELKLKCNFYSTDAFEFVPKIQCDAAFNWHTSFGYSENTKVNLLMLKCAFESIKPKGHFILDFPNIVCTLKNFERSMIRHIPSPQGDILIVRESIINLAKGMLEQQWTIVKPSGQKIIKNSSVKLYLPNMLEEMLREVGFSNIEFYSSIEGKELDLNVPRCICRATKN